MAYQLGKFLAVKRLMGASRTVIHQSDLRLRLCFLLGGLDEFEGSHEEMVDLLKEIAEVRNVKVCLSSQPW